jgi:hypothetical protein
MVAAALFVALLGLVPTLSQAPAWIAQTTALLGRLIPLLAKSGYQILKSGSESASPVLVLLPCLSAAVLLAVGLLVAKRLPRVAMIERGV